MTKKVKNLEYYLSLPWKFEFEKCSEGGYYARVKGLSCYSHGNNLEHAAEQIESALETYLEGSIEENIPIVEPVSEDECSGRISIRVSKSLHCKLSNIAKDEDVSVSHLVNDALIKVYDKTA
ncbi:MAG: type II toxin-antitoxin system HicB family antitoxin [bacterium]